MELEPNMPDEAWKDVSQRARELSLALLRKCPKKRLNAAQALAQPWFRDPAKPSPFGNAGELSSSIFDGLAEYRAHNKLKRAVLQLLARELSEGQVEELRAQFMALDSMGDGLLSLEELAEGMQRAGCCMSSEELEQIVAALDVTGKRRIGYKEFVSALIERRVEFSEWQLWECYQKFDTVGRGWISYEDVRTMFFSSESAPGITESEWEEIAASCSPPGGGSLASSGGAVSACGGGTADNVGDRGCTHELTFEAFCRLMNDEVARAPAAAPAPDRGPRRPGGSVPSSPSRAMVGRLADLFSRRRATPLAGPGGGGADVGVDGAAAVAAASMAAE